MQNMYGSSVVHVLCQTLDRLSKSEGRIASEILQALMHLLELDIAFPNDFGEENSVAVMVEEVEGFACIEKMQMSDLHEDLKKKGRELLDTYYNLNNDELWSLF